MSDTHRAVKRRTIAIAAAALLLPSAVNAQDWRTSTFSRQPAGERQLEVDIEYGAGELKIGPASAGTLYRAQVRYDANTFTPELSYKDARLRFRIEGHDNVRGKRNLDRSLLDLRLSPGVPLDLDLAFGAADAQIELGGLDIHGASIQTGASRTRLTVARPNAIACESFEISVGAARFEASGLGNLNARSFSLEGGVGEVILDFTGTWKQDLAASIEMGLGSLTLRLPEGLGVRVEKDGILAAFDSQRLTKRGNVYYSSNWESAKHKLSLDLSAALGSIKVEWVDS